MSAPPSGSSSKKAPTREPTHPALDMERMMRLAGDLEDALADRGEGELSPELVEDIAADLGVRESHIYVAAATMSKIPCAGAGAHQVELCVGHCQKWGAVELLDRVLDVHGLRRAAEQPSFDVVARSCLDRCAGAPVVLLRTPDGSAGLTEATVARIDEALSELLAT